jgi:hypothetical protein
MVAVVSVSMIAVVDIYKELVAKLLKMNGIKNGNHSERQNNSNCACGNEKVNRLLHDLKPL